VLHLPASRRRRSSYVSGYLERQRVPGTNFLRTHLGIQRDQNRKKPVLPIRPSSPYPGWVHLTRDCYFRPCLSSHPRGPRLVGTPTISSSAKGGPSVLRALDHGTGRSRRLPKSDQRPNVARPPPAVTRFLSDNQMTSLTTRSSIPGERPGCYLIE
jgi:hypothetical protein